MTALAEALELVAAPDLQQRCLGVERLADVRGPEATEALAGLLSESSWYLRDRVVEALVARRDAREAVLRVLRHGSWFARASACDALGRAAEEGALRDLLTAVEDRNVSLQKSAATAIRRIGESVGERAVAESLGELPPERRRRVVTRIGHQEPHWASRLERELELLPAPRSEPPPQDTGPPPYAAGESETRALVRFRRWVASLPRGAR